MRIDRLVIAFVGVLLIIFVSGCSSPPVKFGINTGANLNPNEKSEPLPVVARIYLLSDDQAFESAGFEELWKDDVAALGDSLLARQELVLTPGSEQRVVLDRRKDTRFAAVMAIFREAQEGQWRAIKPLSNDYVTRYFRKTLHLKLNGNIVEFE